MSHIVNPPPTMSGKSESEESLSWRDRERILRRKAILDAARQVFAEKGYEHATLDEVAERAQFGKGTLYNYFPGGKQDILLAVLEEVFYQLTHMVHAHLLTSQEAQEPVRVVWRNLIARLIQFFLNQRDLFQLIIKEVQRMVLSNDDALVRRLLPLRQQVIDAMLPHLERGIAASSLRPIPPAMAAHALLGHVQGYMMYLFTLDSCMRLEMTDAPTLTPDEAADMIAIMLLDGLVLRPDAPFSSPQ